MTTPKTDWLMIALIFCVGLFAAGQFIKISLLLAPLAAHYQTDVPIISFLVSLVGIIGIIFGLIAGNLVARFGARQVMIWALVLGAASSFVQMALPNFWIMVGLRAVEGISHLALVVAAPALMAQVSSDADRPIAMAIWATFFGMAFALASLLVPWLLMHGGIALVFGFHGMGLGLLTLLILWRAPYSERQAQSFNYLTLMREVYRNPRLYAPGLSFLFYTFLYVALLTFLPEHLGDASLGQSLPLISLVGTILAGFAGRRFRSEVLSRIGFGAVAISALGLMLGLQPLVFVMFFFFGVIPAAQFAMIPDLNESQANRAKASGAIAQLGNIGTVTGTPVMAFALVAFGPDVLIWITLFIAGIGYLTVGVLDRQVRKV